ncbi:MAG: methyltransferase [Steroidobacteraceae bacterium]
MRIRQSIRVSYIITSALIARHAHAEQVPAYVSAAVASPSRPDIDRQRDADRKPADVIAFSGLKPGDKVADFMPGRGYFTRIFCPLVGDAGHVYAISVPRNPPPMPSVVDAPPTGCTNVTAITLQQRKQPAPELWSSSDDPGAVYEYWSFSPPAETFATPEPLDVIWTSENYHDLHNKAFGSPNLQLVNRAFLNALKPGGVLIIEDHAAAAGSGARDTQTLHRIDAELVKREVTTAGFQYVGASEVLRHSNDPHTVKAHEMHDQTDRFVLKFRKP